MVKKHLKHYKIEPLTDIKRKGVNPLYRSIFNEDELIETLKIFKTSNERYDIDVDQVLNIFIFKLKEVLSKYFKQL